MVRFTPGDIAFIKENFENYAELVHADNVDEVLFPIDRLILLKGYKKGYEDLNIFGMRAKKVHDHISSIN